MDEIITYEKNKVKREKIKRIYRGRQLSRKKYKIKYKNTKITLLLHVRIQKKLGRHHHGAGNTPLNSGLAGTCKPDQHALTTVRQCIGDQSLWEIGAGKR